MLPMPDDTEPNTRSSSTTSLWEWRKIRRRPTGPSSASAAPIRGVSPRAPLTLTVRYLGGAEAWLEVRARGRTIKVPGHRASLDLMIQLWGQEP